MAKKILLVDDEPDVRSIVAMRLKTFGYDVTVAENGSEALISLSNNKPDLILLDVVMPGRDGYEVCNEIKSNADTACIPVILFTANSKQEERLASNYEFIAADDYILKPAEPKDLLLKIRKFIG